MRFFGKVGYGVAGESENGVWSDQITEKEYYGDVVQNSRRLVADEHLNQELAVEVSISILADAFANEHFHAIKYVEWQGALWSVSTVKPERPRLVLRLGGVYNGPSPTSSSSGRDTGR
jgi:hypothetical protein